MNWWLNWIVDVDACVEWLIEVVFLSPFLFSFLFWFFFLFFFFGFCFVFLFFSFSSMVLLVLLAPGHVNQVYDGRR